MADARLRGTRKKHRAGGINLRAASPHVRDDTVANHVEAGTGQDQGRVARDADGSCPQYAARTAAEIEACQG
jgi:hypothetical protein